MLVSGLGIWLHSLVIAYRDRNFGNIAVAGWNTFAQFHNTWEAASQTPGVIKHIASVLGDTDDDSAYLIIGALVLVALALGIITTALIVRWADKRVAIEVVRAR